VEEVYCLNWELASAVNKTAATCEQVSPSPAIHMQWAQIISSLCLIVTYIYIFSDTADSLCECFTRAVKDRHLTLYWTAGHRNEFNVADPTINKIVISFKAFICL